MRDKTSGGAWLLPVLTWEVLSFIGVYLLGPSSALLAWCTQLAIVLVWILRNFSVR